MSAAPAAAVTTTTAAAYPTYGAYPQFAMPTQYYGAPLATGSVAAPAGASYVPPVVLDAKTIQEQQATATKQLEEQSARLAQAAKTQYDAQKAYLAAEAKRVENLTVQQIMAASEQQCFELDWQKREQELQIEQEYQRQRASIISTAQALTAQAQQQAANRAMTDALSKIQLPGYPGAGAAGAGFPGFPMMSYAAAPQVLTTPSQ